MYLWVHLVIICLLQFFNARRRKNNDRYKEGDFCISLKASKPCFSVILEVNKVSKMHVLYFFRRLCSKKDPRRSIAELHWLLNQHSASYWISRDQAAKFLNSTGNRGENVVTTDFLNIRKFTFLFSMSKI